MVIKKLAALLLAFFLLSGIYVNPAMSKNINPKNITAQKENQKPLLLSEKSRVLLKKSTATIEGGAISGKLYYGDNPYFEPFYYPVFVAVWPVDSTGDSYIRYALAEP